MVKSHVSVRQKSVEGRNKQTINSCAQFECSVEKQRWSTAIRPSANEKRAYCKAAEETCQYCADRVRGIAKCVVSNRVNTFSNTRLEAPDNRNRTGKNRSLLFVLKLVDWLAILASAVAI